MRGKYTPTRLIILRLLWTGLSESLLSKNNPCKTEENEDYFLDTNVSYNSISRIRLLFRVT
jgi:hypothetical protein